MSIGNRPAQYFPPRDEVIVINNDPDPLKAEVILRTYSPISDSYKDEYVDMSLAPGNPELAAQIQKRNKQISDTKSALLLAPIGPKGLGFVGSKLSGLRQKLPSFFTKPGQIPLQITPGSRGLPRSQQQSAGVMLDPSKPQLTGLSKFLLGIPAFGLPYAALSSLQTQPLTGEDLEEAVDQAKITQKQSNEIQEQLNVISEDKTTQPSDITKIVEDPDPEPKPKLEPAPEEDAPPVKELEDVGQERFIDPDNLIAFVRNVGAGLSTTGQLGTGLTLGSKMAAEERAKRDILEKQQTSEMEKEEALLNKKFELEKELAQIKKGQDFSKYQDQLIKLNDKSKEIEGLDTTANLFASAKIYLEGGDATGLGPELTSMFNKVARYFGAETELSDREKAINILNAIANANVQEITGEPEGARISDTDRKVAKELVGNIEKMGSDTQNALDRIDLQLNNIGDRRTSSFEDFDILAIGLPFEDVKRYMPTTTLQSGASTADLEISYDGPR